MPNEVNTVNSNELRSDIVEKITSSCISVISNKSNRIQLSIHTDGFGMTFHYLTCRKKEASWDCISEVSNIRNFL